MSGGASAAFGTEVHLSFFARSAPSHFADQSRHFPHEGGESDIRLNMQLVAVVLLQRYKQSAASIQSITNPRVAKPFIRRQRG